MIIYTDVQITGPFAGLLLADYGATVLRLDRSTTTPHPTSDQLTRRKTSICVNIKSPGGISLIKKLLRTVDVVIDPFRPGVLEKAGLSPEDVMLKLNPRLIVARMTGFRRDGKYKDMAGHDINYIAVSGVLSMFGRAGEKPYPPGNVVGDFAGGGAMCFLGILLALLARERSGFGQVVEANMVDGSAMLATMPRLGTKTDVWSGPRGTNLLDGGAPYYDTYETKDGKYMAVYVPFFTTPSPYILHNPLSLLILYYMLIHSPEAQSNRNSTPPSSPGSHSPPPPSPPATKKPTGPPSARSSQLPSSQKPAQNGNSSSTAQTRAAPLSSRSGTSKPRASTNDLLLR